MHPEVLVPDGLAADVEGREHPAEIVADAVSVLRHFELSLLEHNLVSGGSADVVHAVLDFHFGLRLAGCGWFPSLYAA